MISQRAVSRSPYAASHKAYRHLLTVSLLALLTACASDGGSDRPAADGRITQCKSGDRQIDSERDCLQDDAACYALASGDWCTGERGSTCPTGSTPVLAGAACPPGARCFEFSESLSCSISVN